MLIVYYKDKKMLSLICWGVHFMSKTGNQIEKSSCYYAHLVCQMYLNAFLKRNTLFDFWKVDALNTTYFLYFWLHSITSDKIDVQWQFTSYLFSCTHENVRSRKTFCPNWNGFWNILCFLQNSTMDDFIELQSDTVYAPLTTTYEKMLEIFSKEELNLICAVAKSQSAKQLIKQFCAPKSEVEANNLFGLRKFQKLI